MIRPRLLGRAMKASFDASPSTSKMKPSAHKAHPTASRAPKGTSLLAALSSVTGRVTMKTQSAWKTKKPPKAVKDAVMCRASVHGYMELSGRVD